MKMFDRVSMTQARTLRPTIAAAVLDDGAVLLDLNSKYFYSLNASAWAIVQLFESGASVADAGRQCAAWGAGDEAAAFIVQLTSYDLLENAAAAAVTAEPPAWNGPWIAPVIEQQAEPLERVIVSAFDPSIDDLIAAAHEADIASSLCALWRILCSRDRAHPQPRASRRSSAR